MQCFVFNLRKPMFQDIRVREALGYAFDFEWAEQESRSSASTSAPRAISRIPSSPPAVCRAPEELKILEPLRGKIPDEVFTKPFTLPTTDGSGNNRANLRQANALLEQAGWTVKNGKRVNKRRPALPLRDPARQSAVRAARAALHPEPEAPGDRCHAAHTSDSAQYTQRTQTFDYDMVVGALRREPVAGQRAALVLGFRRRRSARQPQSHRHQESCHRHPDRAGHLRARPPAAHHPHPRPRPGAALELLRHPPFLHGRRSPGLLEHLRPAEGQTALFRRLRHLVDRSARRRRP